MENNVVETLLDRIATARKRTGPFGERVPSRRADLARDVLVELVETYPESFGGRVDAETLRFYLGHDRDALNAAAAAVLGVVVEHGTTLGRLSRHAMTSARASTSTSSRGRLDSPSSRRLLTGPSSNAPTPPQTTADGTPRSPARRRANMDQPLEPSPVQWVRRQSPGSNPTGGLEWRV